MELELGLKLTREVDELTTDFQIAKDRAGPVFLSRETDAMLVLTAHLKGYKRSNIKIDINEDGSLIGISGERKVQETVMVGWKMYKKDTETKGFKKVFRIPDGVILDNIEAKFNEDESTLTITMPKKVKGIRGTAIEEVKEKQELVREGSGALQIVDEKSQKAGISNLEKDENSKARIGEDDKIHEMPTEGSKEMPEEREEGQPKSPSIYYDSVETEARKEDVENQKKVDDIQEISEPKDDQELDRAESLSVKQLGKEDLPETKNQVSDKANEIHEEAAKSEPGKVQEREDKPRGKRCKMCIPIVAGSTLLLSFVVFVIQIIRSKNQTSRKRD